VYLFVFPQNDREEIDEEITRLSLKYNFVTQLTAMVVTKPQGKPELVVEEQWRKEGHFPQAMALSRAYPPVPTGTFEMMSCLFNDNELQADPEHALRRVMSSETIHDEQLTKYCKQLTNN